MLFYLRNGDLSSFDLGHLVIPQEEDIFYYRFEKRQPISFKPIYISPVFNLDSLNNKLLIVNESIRKVQVVNESLYTFITLIYLQKQALKLPFLYKLIDNNIIHINPYFDYINYYMYYLLNRYNLDFIHIDKYHAHINVNLLDSLRIIQCDNEYRISIFGSEFYLYNFIKLYIPSYIDKFYWIVDKYYYNNTLLPSNSYEVNVKFLTFKTQQAAQNVIDMIKAIFLLYKM